jgi:peroxiredoxin
MFPPPAYELPNNALFEITRVLQVVPAGMAGRLLYRLVRSRWARRTDSTGPSIAKGRRRAPHASSTEGTGGAAVSGDARGTQHLNVGDTVVRRTLTSASGPPVSLLDGHRLVHLQFRRFAGCPVCSLHLRSFSRREREIASSDILEVVVFHSAADDLRPYAGDPPFPVIADPEKRLYVEFGVESSPRALLDLRAWPAMLRGSSIASSRWCAGSSLLHR